MAFGAKKIYPIDRKPGTAVGISLPFNAPAVFKPTYTTSDSIKNNLINFFLTNNTERYLNPTFGGNLREFLFEQINSNTTDSLKEDVQSKLTVYFPNVKVKELNVYESTDTNSLEVDLKYEIVGTGIEDEIEIVFN